MAYTETIEQLNDARRRILEIRAEIRELQAQIEPEAVEDYTLRSLSGPVQLSELFGDKDDLIVLHNMGSGCAYCTLWADGFNGELPHLEDRAAFVLTSPESPAKQKEFADSRGWNFRMISHEGSNFAADMGFYAEEGEYAGWHPGVSAFKKSADGLVRVSHTQLGPGDDFCAVWHLFDLLPEGADGWSPQYQY